MVKYIAVDGLDGCGKSTLITNLSKELTNRGIRHQRLSMLSPGPIRSMILEAPLHPHIELLLLRAAALEASLAAQSLVADGITVLMDRSQLSFLGYQGAGRKEGPRTFRLVQDFPLALDPDLVFYLKAPLDVLEQRIDGRGSPDHIDSEEREFKERAMDLFDSMEGKLKGLVTLDAQLPPQTLTEQAMKYIQKREAVST